MNKQFKNGLNDLLKQRYFDIIKQVMTEEDEHTPSNNTVSVAQDSLINEVNEILVNEKITENILDSIFAKCTKNNFKELFTSN